ncbi:MAG: hypothetical protein ACUVSW_00550 [Roseiflexus sp.]
MEILRQQCHNRAWLWRTEPYLKGLGKTRGKLALCIKAMHLASASCRMAASSA